jgi:hexosaminidase
MRTVSLSTLATLLFVAFTFANTPETSMKPSNASAPAIIPQPRQMTVGKGTFTLNRNTVLYAVAADSELLPCITTLAEAIRHSTGYPLPVKDVKMIPERNFIIITSSSDKSLGAEGYRIKVTKTEISITAGGARGALYGAVSVLQLLPPAVFSPEVVRNVAWSVPCVEITDAPRYSWRGMHLDVSRHFFPKEFVKRFIDYLVLHKMNTFHWHLTDDQGWRVEIKKYPKLTSIGAWRVNHEDIHWNIRPPQKPGEQAAYGGFYTQDDIREVVKYAASRCITVVPEIEMPAHATAVISAYPELSCTGGPFTVPPGGLWPIKDIFCAGTDSTFTFIENVLTEVAGLFPGQYIHIGGDEADKTEWKRCPKCQARIRAEHLANEEELQSFFIKRVEKILTGLGKRLIGWDEILEGGLAPQATVMSWRGIVGGIAAARSGHDVVMSPTSNCYFDYYQADPRGRPLAFGGYLPLQRAYEYNPTPDSLTADEARHILGVQGNLWSEYMPEPARVEYMAFPRIAAMAENGWSQKEAKSWPDFLARLERQFERYAALHINAALCIHEVAVQESVDVAAHRATVTLVTQVNDPTIRYTLDGTKPSVKSPKYTKPITLKKSATVTAAAFKGSRRLADPTSRVVLVPQHAIASVTFTPALDSVYAKRGTSSIGNGRRGYASRDDIAEWRGAKKIDLVMTADLGKVVPVKKVTTGFLNQATALVFLPSRVSVAVSNDGTTFTEAGSVTYETLQKEPKSFVQDCTIALKNVKARYIRITAVNPGPVPAWHLKAGEPTAILSDEIVVE